MAPQDIERRLTTILVADVVGYSRLMEADESGTLAQIKANRREVIEPKTAQHNGRVVKLMGDGTLMEFASVTDAVLFAMEVQRAMIARNEQVPEERRIIYRVGITLGDVIVEGDDIYGEGVNLATRLEGLADSGGVVVSASVHDQIVGKLDVAFDDMGECKLKNLTQPVHAYRAVIASPGKGAEQEGAVEAVIGRPAIAVLPFDNMSGEPEQEYFSDGLSEDIITALAAWRTFPVIARNSTFAYKGQSIDIRQVAKDLGVRYVLEGSVRKAGNRVRVTAQLIEGKSGKHVWAKRYDRDLEDIFAVQDEITASIAAEIEPEMSKAEISAVAHKRPDNLGSWELYLQGLSNMPSYGKHREETKQLFRQSIDADRSFAGAYAALALCHAADIYALRTDDVEASIGQMFDLAKRASLIDPQNFRGHQALCRAHFWKGDHANAVKAGRRAVELNPSAPESYEVLAVALTHLGRPEEAERCAKTCLKLSPVDPRIHDYYFQLMQASLAQGRFEEAWRHMQPCLEARPHDVVLLGFRTILLGHLGRRDEAAACLADYLARRKIKTADDYRKLFIPNSAIVEINLEGLRKAGWKDGG